MSIPLIQALLVVVILAVMVLLLLGISHIFSGSFSVRQEDAEALRSELDKNEDIVTHHSILSEIVKVNDSEKNKIIANQDYKPR